MWGGKHGGVPPHGENGVPCDATHRALRGTTLLARLASRFPAGPVGTASASSAWYVSRKASSLVAGSTSSAVAKNSESASIHSAPAACSALGVTISSRGATRRLPLRRNGGGGACA